MAQSSQGATVTFDGSALTEVTSVTATKNKEAAAANDNRLDVSHLGIANGGDRLYLDAPLKDVAASATGDGTTGDVSVEMFGTPPSAGATGALSISGGGLSFSATCVQVTSSAVTLAVGEAAKSSVTFTIVADDECD